MGVVIAGGARLRRTLRQAGVDMKELRAINRKAADVVAPVATSTAPRRSGALAGSVRTAATNRAGIVRAGRKAIPYAGPIHWGWSARNIAPNPWITAAATATESAWVDEYYDHMSGLLNSVRGI